MIYTVWLPRPGRSDHPELCFSVAVSAWARAAYRAEREEAISVWEKEGGKLAEAARVSRN